MAWSRPWWNPEEVDPLDHRLWDELLAAVAERRMAAGLNRCAATTQMRRDRPSIRVGIADGSLLAPLAADIAELAPLFLHPPSVRFNSGTLLADETEQMVSPLAPAPPYVSSHLPARLCLARGLSPWSTAAREALAACVETLNRMCVLALEPNALFPGQNPDSVGWLARRLFFGATAGSSGPNPVYRSLNASVPISGVQYADINWAVKVEGDFLADGILRDGYRYRMVAADPYVVSQQSWWDGDFLAYAPLGGRLLVHTIAKYEREDETRGDYDTDWHTWRAIPASGSDGGVTQQHVSELVHDLVTHTFIGGFGGPGPLGADSSDAALGDGWHSLGNIGPGVAAGIMPVSPPDPPTGYTDNWQDVIDTQFGGDDTHVYSAQCETWRLGWEVDCAALDLTGVLDYYAPPDSYATDETDET